MAEEENEEALDLALDKFKRTMVEYLKDSAFIGKSIGKKTNKFLNKVKGDLDTKKLETVGLEVINMFNSVKKSMWAIADSLEKSLDELNKNNDDMQFKELKSKLLEYTMHAVALSSDSKHTLKIPSDKDTQTDLPSVSSSNSNASQLPHNKQVKIEKYEIDDKAQIELNKDQENSDISALNDCKERGTVNLGLNKTETQDTEQDEQDTDDCWIDSMDRGPSIIEVWNKMHQKEEINATDDYQGKLKQEQEDGNRWNQKTPDLNCGTDTSDDMFIDGRTPEESKDIVKQSGDDSDVEDKKEIDMEAESAPKLEESFVVEENKLSVCCVDTAPNSKKDRDNENSSTSSVAANNNNKLDSKIEKTEENTRDGKKSPDINLHIKIGSLDADLGIEMCSKPKNIPLELDEIVSDEVATERENSEPNVHKTDKTDNILKDKKSVTENSEEYASSSIETDKLENNMETMEEDEYVNPYSVETVKIDSDTEEVPSIHSSENSDSEHNMATQLISHESINLSLHSGQKEKQMIDTQELNKCLSCASTEELDLDNTQDINGVCSKFPNSEIEKERSDIEETEMKILNSNIDNSIKHSDKNMGIPCEIKQTEPNVETAPILPLFSNAQASRNYETDSKQSIKSPNSQSADTEVVNSGKDNQLICSPNPQYSDSRDIDFNKDTNLPLTAANAKYSVESSNPQTCSTENSLEDVNLSPNSLTQINKSSDAKQSPEFPNFKLPGPNGSNLDQCTTLSPNSLASKDVDEEQSFDSPETLVLKDQVPDAKQSQDSPNSQFTGRENSNSDDLSKSQFCDANQSALELKYQEPVSKQTPNSQLSDTNECNPVEDINLSPTFLESSDKAADAEQYLGSPNAKTSAVKLKDKEPTAEQSLESHNHQFSNINSNPDGDICILTSNAKASDLKDQEPDAIEMQLSDTKDSDSGENINTSPTIISSNGDTFGAEQSLVSPNTQTTASKGEVSDSNQSLDCRKTQSSTASDSILNEDTNLSPNCLPLTNKATDANQSPNPQFSVTNQNEIPSSENGINVSLSSETVIVIESDTDQELETQSCKSLDNLGADIKNKMSETSDSQNTEEYTSYLSKDETCVASKQSLTEASSQYDSDATDICRDENELIKQMVTANNNDNFPNKLDCDGEDVLSQGSNKSFEFDISENLSCIDNLVYKDEYDNKSTEDIVEALEGLLSQKNPNEAIGIKETIEIASDSDSDVHLDVTMEEILSTGSHVEECVSDLEDVEERDDIQEIKPPKSPECTSKENLPENENVNLSENAVGDELLELLREVEVSTVTNISYEDKEKFDKKDAKNADEIFKMLQRESSLEISDSDLSEEDTNWELNDTESSGSENVKKLYLEDDNTHQLLKEYDMKDCYVSIERLELDEEDIVVVNKSLNDSVDKLCDINSIISKRKYSSADLQDKSKMRKFKKAHKSTKKGTSDSESLSDFSNSDSDTEPRDDHTFSPILTAPLERKLDVMLANEICKTLTSNSGHDSTDDESDNSRKSSKKIKKGDKNGENNANERASKPILSKEEKEKKAWKNDPLLRGRLNSDSDTTTTTSSEKSTKRKKHKKLYEHDTDFNIVSDVDVIDSSSDSEIYQQNKVWLEEKLISPIKKNIPISDTDSDSDCEFVPQSQRDPQNSPDGAVDEAGPSNSQKGRRNIRALMSDENLAEATQRANKEEQERIERLEDRSKVMDSLSQSFSQRDEEDLLVLDVDEELGEPLITVDRKLCIKMKPHQRIGVQFMWDSCYESVKRLEEHDEGSGCILAHCMGLGKTFQVLSLIHTLFSYDVTNTRHVLVVCPLSTVNNWRNEVKIAFKDCPEEMFRVLTIADKRQTSMKYEIVKKWLLRKKCVLVLGYDAFEVLTNELKLDKAGSYIKERMLEALVDPGPDLVICDEGHLLRNRKALKTMALNRINTKRRIVLTGTPLQNNLLEYYHMVQFVKPNLLGTMKEYKTNFVNPITNGQYEDSTKEDIKLMMKRTHVLHTLLKKTIQRIEDKELKIYLPRMVDHAVFIQLHQVQVELYQKFSEIIRNSANTNNKGFLSDFYIFQYIGTHPQLLAVMESMKNKKIKERDLITNEQEDNPICNIDGWWKAKIPEDASEKIEYGNKLVVLKSILEECEAIGDKLLVFSQSLGELDLIEHFLKKVGTANCPSWQKRLDYFRMDGTVLPEGRYAICDKFNDKENKRMRLLLMSTRVGGLGLNLTAANRVVIMTVNWNPSFDTQSVFRVYRFGQEKEVFIYRLISQDTMEEKVYQRTVTKLAIAHRVVDRHQITRHYKCMDLQELYSCKPNADEERPTPNVPEDKVLAKLILKLPFIYKYHEHRTLLANRPEDNLNEQELNAAWDEFKKIKDAPPPPPAPPVLPQIPPTNGPTYADAHALLRLPTITNVQSMAKKKVPTENHLNEDNLKQYYVPKPNTSNTQQQNDRPVLGQLRNDVKRNINIKNTNTLNGKPKLPSDTVINLIDTNSEMIPLPPLDAINRGSNIEQDPLYISEKSNASKTNNAYSRVLAYYAEKQLPAGTSIIIEDESPKKNSQKENGELVRAPRIPNTSLVIDVEHEKNKRKGSNKRKRNVSDVDKNSMIKKMKDNFNRHVSSERPISLDDEMELTDTTSESGSLSNEIIQNLGRSGITVHKVMKNSKRINDVITLD